MTDSTLLKRGKGNGNRVSVYMCMNELQKRDDLQKYQIRKIGRIQGKENGHGQKEAEIRRRKLNWKKTVSFQRNLGLSALKE